MTNDSSILRGKRVGVIGFNARPIAASLKRQGAETYISDYWGDTDLAEVSHECIAVLAPVPGIRQRQPLDMPMHLALLENFAILTKDVSLDYIITGSGFDDRAESLISLHKSGILVGSTPEQIAKSRDLSLLSKMNSKEQYKIPRRQVIKEGNALVEESRKFEFPYLVRPLHSGGGFGIRFIRRPKDLKRFDPLKTEENEASPLMIQEYIEGRDISCSVLVTENEAKAISVQGQLIGSPIAGRNCDFAYCGNFYPSGLDTAIEQMISEISMKLSLKLGLKGSVGFDYVVDHDETIWLMEINPRIQGTLEMLEMAGDISITEQHVKAWKFNEIDDIPTFNPSVKMIVYSRTTGYIPDLSQFPNTFDKSPAGVLVNQGDPICTLINSATQRESCYELTCETALSIQRSVAPLET